MQIDPDGKFEFKVALDDLTVARLMEVADGCHCDPATVIASMIHDILEDDALAHDDGMLKLQ